MWNYTVVASRRVLADRGLTVSDRPQRIGQSVVSISQVPLRNDSGEDSGQLVLLQDITRVYQLEEQLQRKDRLAAMGELIGRIAHEIRNPLGSVELFASLLQRDLNEHEPTQRYAQQISQAVQLMDGLLAKSAAVHAPDALDAIVASRGIVTQRISGVGCACDCQSARRRLAWTSTGRCRRPGATMGS